MNPTIFIQQFYQWLQEEPKKVTFQKNDYLSIAGDTEKYLYFIISGAVRVIYPTNEEDFTLRFGYKNSIISSLDSFITNKPSQFYLQALRKTSAYQISKIQYQKYIQSSSTILTIHNQLIENLVVGMLDREIDLLTTSPATRLKRLITRSPQVFQEIPLKYIASYLRMTPETLSRLRNLDLNQDDKKNN